VRRFLRVSLSHFKGDHAAERDAAYRDSVYVQLFQQLERIGCKLRDRDALCPERGLAVAAQVNRHEAA
jgi:hypothetical protein